MGKQGFDKFIKKELKGAAKKEAFKQEKRKMKAELRVKGEEARQRNLERYRLVTGQSAESPFGKSSGDKRSDGKKGADRPKKKYTPSDKRTKDSSGKATFTKPVGRPAKAGTENEKTFSSKEREKRPIGEKVKKPYSAKKDKTSSIGKNIPTPAFANTESGIMPLNKFLAHGGVCGRREAATLIKDGLVEVNGLVVDEPGFKVSPESDKITFKGKQVFPQNNLVYILLNKPKDHITTTSDPQGRRTVFDLIKTATPERVYPVGRLDRNTTGVLLLTNDGELAQKLTHPKFGIKKIYEAKLDKPLTKKDAEAILEGVTLEDGFIQADSVGFMDERDKSIVGIEIHSGKNRVVRRIFEHLGYDVKNLDRVMFANLTKKNVERGHWRFLNEKEVRLLKYLNKSVVRKLKNDKE